MNEPTNIKTRATAGVGDVPVTEPEPICRCGTKLLEGSFRRWGCPKCEPEKCRKCGALRFQCSC